MTPGDPVSGRGNNQGFEGLTISPSGKLLYALLQSATIQDGGSDSATRRYTRLLTYDISKPGSPVYKSEQVVPLPIYKTAKGKDRVAAQSEIHALSKSQFLVLSRDSGAGHGADDSKSLYRQVDVFDISSASDVAGPAADSLGGSIATSKGVLNSTITPATYCPFLDFNDNDQLAKFGLHNGGDQDSGLLNEKWEGLALAPVKPGKKGDEYFLFAFSDNDFITQDGYLKGGEFKYADESGFNLDSQALVFRVELPK